MNVLFLYKKKLIKVGHNRNNNNKNQNNTDNTLIAQALSEIFTCIVIDKD